MCRAHARGRVVGVNACGVRLNRRLKPSMKVNDVAKVMLECNGTRNSLMRQRARTRRETIKTLGKKTGTASLNQDEIHIREGYLAMRGQLVKLADKTTLRLYGVDPKESPVADAESGCIELSAEEMQERVALVLLWRLYERKVPDPDAFSEEHLGGSLHHEISSVFYATTILIEKMLRESYQKRDRGTILAILGYSALFTSGVWSSTDPQCINIVKEDLKKGTGLVCARVRVCCGCCC